jgi:hypothetical protein
MLNNEIHFVYSKLNLLLKLAIIFLFQNATINGQLYLTHSYPERFGYLPLETRETYGPQQSSECALILQRTYVNGKRGKSHAPLYGGFFDLFRRDGYDV